MIVCGAGGGGRVRLSSVCHYTVLAVVAWVVIQPLIRFVFLSGVAPVFTSKDFDLVPHMRVFSGEVVSAVNPVKSPEEQAISGEIPTSTAPEGSLLFRDHGDSKFHRGLESKLKGSFPDQAEQPRSLKADTLAILQHITLYDDADRPVEFPLVDPTILRREDVPFKGDLSRYAAGLCRVWGSELVRIQQD